MDSIKDILSKILDGIRRFFEYISDSMREDKSFMIGVIIIIIAVIIGVIYFTFSYESRDLTPNAKPNTLEEVEGMKDVSEDLDETFSELETIDMTTGDYPAYEVSLFLKKPFIDKRDLERDLEEYIDILKWKTDDNLLGLKIELYDRKEVFDKDLKPRATVYYSEELDDSDIETEDEGGERERGEDTFEKNYQDTMIKEEEPDYEEYDMFVQDFQEMDYKEGVEPLTDQEFSFYLKLDMYSTLIGGSRYGGEKLYLQWDLGKDIYEDGMVSIQKEFEEFKERHLELGGQETYYDNEYLLKDDLVISNPQLLLFAEQDEIEEDPLEAQKKLLEEDPDQYERPLKDYAEERSEDLSELFEGDEQEEGEQEGNNEEQGENGEENNNNNEDTNDGIEKDDNNSNNDFEIESNNEDSDND